MNTCIKCHKDVSYRLASGMCSVCYRYFKILKYREYEVTNENAVNYVEEEGMQKGMVICNLCHRAYNKLGSHLYYFHNMSKREYCKKYGLDVANRMTSDKYIDKMRKYIIANYDVVVKQNIIEKGKPTRFKTGHDNHYERSLQTKRRLSERGKKLSEQYRNKPRTI